MIDLATRAEGEDTVAALEALAKLRRRLESEEEALVHRARTEGRSWAEIAAALGVSRQAVHKKYVGGLFRRRT